MVLIDPRRYIRRMADIDVERTAAARRRHRRRVMKAGLYIAMMGIGLIAPFAAVARSEYDWVHAQESTAWIAPAMIAAGMGLSAVVSWAQGQLRREADRRRQRAAAQS